MPPPIGIQLYTVHAALAEDFESVVRHIAEIGYAGVEFAGLYGESPASAAKLVRELGMDIACMHAQTPMLDNLTVAIDNAKIMDVKRVICAWLPVENFASRDTIHKACDDLNTINEILRGNALELHYHNHWAECAMVDGKFAYQHMLDFLEPTVGFEVDVYWAKTAGADPANMVREIGKRAPLLHIKDGPATMDGDMTAVGDGVVDMRAISNASKDTAEWWLVRLDRTAGDMMQAVEKSYQYITQQGFAHGK